MTEPTSPAPTPSVPLADLPPGAVRRAGPWTVANRGGDLRAVSSRCRHQLADLSEGTLDKDGCLVCPWHGAKYDLDSGRMTEGPKGFLAYVGKTPGYEQMVKAYSQVLKLRTRRVRQQGSEIVVDEQE